MYRSCGCCFCNNVYLVVYNVSRQRIQKPARTPLGYSSRVLLTRMLARSNNGIPRLSSSRRARRNYPIPPSYRPLYSHLVSRTCIVYLLGAIGGNNFVKHGFHSGIFRLWALHCDGNKYRASTSSGTRDEAKDGTKVCLQSKQGDDSKNVVSDAM